MNFLHLTKHTHFRNGLSKSSFWRHIGRDPFIDWALIVTVSFVIAVGLILFGVYTYFNMDKELTKLTSAPAKNTLTTIDTAALTKVINDFDTRAAERTNLIGGYAGGIADPSI